MRTTGISAVLNTNLQVSSLYEQAQSCLLHGDLPATTALLSDALGRTPPHQHDLRACILRLQAESLDFLGQSEQALSILHGVESDDRSVSIALEAQRGHSMCLLGRIDPAYQHLTRALANAQAANDDLISGYVHARLATVHQRRNQWQRGGQHAAAAAEIGVAHGDTVLQLYGLFGVVKNYRSVMGPDDALPLCLEALEIARAADLRVIVAKLLVEVGTCYLLMRRLDEAEENLQSSRDMLASMKCITLNVAIANLGNVYMRRLQYDRALELFQEAVDLARAAHDEYATALWLHNMGIVYSRTGKRGDASVCLTEAAARFRNAGDDTSMRAALDLLRSVVQ